MNLKDWIKTTPIARRLEACEEIGTTMDYLWQIAGGHSRAGAKKALAIEAATGVSRQELRPDIFGHPPAAGQRPQEAA